MCKAQLLHWVVQLPLIVICEQKCRRTNATAAPTFSRFF